MDVEPEIIEIRCPDLGLKKTWIERSCFNWLSKYFKIQLSGTRIELTRWMVQDASDVTKDQTVVEIETSKVTIELPATCSGMIVQLIAEGQTIAPQDVLAIIEP